VNTFADVWRKLFSRKYRAAFARTQFKRLVPLQIQTLRKQRGWSQEELAERAQLTQGVISRAEDQDYGNLTVNTILSVAEGLDVAFVGRFVPFSELNRWYVNLSQGTMRVPSFDEENAAMSATEALPNAMAFIQGGGQTRESAGNVIAFREMEGKGQESLPNLDRMLLQARSNGGLEDAAFSNSSR
jgi:transcriptional regulator with XRE-family HTH domain